MVKINPKLFADTIYPIGSIIIKSDNADYSNWLGFTWERTLVGRVAVGIDSTQTEFDTIGETGGEKTHTLIQAEAPVNTVFSDGGESSGTWVPGKWATYDGYVLKSGGGQAHNILQPYQVVAYWKRTA